MQPRKQNLISTSMTLLKDHHYIISSNVDFYDNSIVTILPGATIRLSPGTALRF
ncbi:MAG TPA: hypothetical protein PLE74_06700 [Candidatus Cloacimonadota bacterium]|nr:hypothetical protein [Candidatus Cloacimonadota bacterium]HPT71953.1 hypothetical protein [Candidatus Cloacimonadota bacterium]